MSELKPENVFVCPGHQKGFSSADYCPPGFSRCIVCVKNDQIALLKEAREVLQEIYINSYDGAEVETEWQLMIEKAGITISRITAAVEE